MYAGTFCKLRITSDAHIGKKKKSNSDAYKQIKIKHHHLQEAADGEWRKGWRARYVTHVQGLIRESRAVEDMVLYGSCVRVDRLSVAECMQ